jgi:hypothetical protein
MSRMLTAAVLAEENLTCRDRAGLSDGNRAQGFRPAFQDTQTEVVYPSLFADGRVAPCHVLDGLPDEVVVARTPAGRVAAVKATVISGFVRMGRFYTREQAALALRLESFVVVAA